MGRRFTDKLWAWIAAPLDRIEGHGLALIGIFSLFYFVGCFFIASKKLMWNDELFTYYIARLPHLGDVWNALATGAEQTPPFFYVITRAAFALFGVSVVSIRLPEILAFWVMCLCLFYFVAKRSSALFGFVAMLLPLMMGTYYRYYPTEARAYALVLGFAAFALLCWRWAIEGQHRRLALAGLAASLAAAIACHYYAVLVLVPFGLGEVVRALKSRKIDWAVWAALIFSLTPLLAFLPLIESARKFAPTFWAKPQWASVVYFYTRFLFRPTVLQLFLLLLIVLFYAALRNSRPEPELARLPRPVAIPAHEIAAAAGFWLIPAVGVILGKTIVGAFNNEYALWAIIGVSISVAWGLAIVLDRHPAMGLTIGAMLCLMFIAREIHIYNKETMQRSDRADIYAFLEDHAKPLRPIEVANPLRFLELTHQPPRDLRGRLLYLADSRLAIEDTGENDVEKGLIEMKQWAGLNVRPYRAALASSGTVFIYAQDYPDPNQWVIPELTKTGCNIELVAWQQNNILLSASLGVVSPEGK